MRLPISLLYVESGPDPSIERTLSKLPESYCVLPTLKRLDVNQIEEDDQPLLILIDAALCRQGFDALTSWMAQQKQRLCGIVPVVDAGDDGALGHSAFGHPAIAGYVTRPVSEQLLFATLRAASSKLAMESEREELSRLVTRQEEAMRELNSIGIALSSERNLSTLLEKILQKSREITLADAGSLYLVEEIEGAPPVEDDFLANKQLRFVLAQNDSIEVPFAQFTMPINRQSIAGFVAITSLPQNIEDCYQLPGDCEFSINRSFDESTGYRTKSMLVIPMNNQKDEIIGVLQLINRKADPSVRLDSAQQAEAQVIPFDEQCEELANSLASQAAIAIENTRLYEEIQTLFEGFIRASVTAIESRDPTTSGHSERVGTLTVGLAEHVDRIDRGPYRDVRFSREQIKEIQYASLLHDFGKIGVRENVLVKAKKLYPYELELLRQRYAYLRKTIELQFSQQKLRYLMDASREALASQLGGLDRELDEKLAKLDDYLEFIMKANEPAVLEETGFERLAEIVEISFVESHLADAIPYLTEDEHYRLSISKGSLSPEERLEIESHVTHTFNFLRQIPWSRDLKRVPQIAYAHHEKLDGSGYPRKINVANIPVQSKMMTISDIYDALTAADRPYKRAMEPDRALDILRFEMQDGHIDEHLYQLFLDARIFELTIPEIGKR